VFVSVLRYGLSHCFSFSSANSMHKLHSRLRNEAVAVIESAKIKTLGLSIRVS